MILRLIVRMIRRLVSTIVRRVAILEQHFRILYVHVLV